MVKDFALTTSMAVALTMGGVASGQDIQGIDLAPGERLVSVDGVPVEQQPSQVATMGAPVVEGAVVEGALHTATNIVGNLVPSGQSFSHSDGATALDKANTERARKGLGALMPDPSLQALALRKATIAAGRNYKNHVGGSLGGAACEGVGHTNGRFLTCCLDQHGTYGGAAMVQGRDGWYCCLLVR